MSAYIVLLWNDAAELEAEAAGQALMQSGRWRLARSGEGISVFTPPASVLDVIVLPGRAGVIVGNVFSHQGVAARDAQSLPFFLGDLSQVRTLAERLCDNTWGRYVLVHRRGASDPIAVFRDPSGDLDCIAWRRGGLTVVASDLPSDLQAWAPDRLAIDDTVLAEILINPVLVTVRPPLSDLIAVAPGALVDLNRPDKSATIWSPRHFLRRDRRPRDQLARDLVRRIDMVTGALAGLYGTVTAEISGGLDSAIIASALTRSGRDRVAAWINYYPPERQGDERRYAQLVAEQNGVTLAAVAKPDLALVADTYALIANTVRPPLNGLDPQYDGELADATEALGGQAIIGGQGGDAVLFQQNTAWLAADALRSHGPWALRPASAVPLAQYSQRSVWGLWARALWSFAGGGRIEPPKPPAYLASQLVEMNTSRLVHPWLRNLRGVLPAKQIQIRGISNCLAFAGACRRRQVADLIHPLMAQPVVELCLSISAFDLTYGRRDRALAREAFRQRLPEAVAERRSKGDLTTYYGRGVAANLPFLRDFLLGGRLVSRGLIHKDRLMDVMDPDQLMHSNDYSSLLVAAGVEAWVRAWEERLGTQEPRAVMSSGQVA